MGKCHYTSVTGLSGTPEESRHGWQSGRRQVSEANEEISNHEDSINEDGAPNDAMDWTEETPQADGPYLDEGDPHIQANADVWNGIRMGGPIRIVVGDGLSSASDNIITKSYFEITRKRAAESTRRPRYYGYSKRNQE